MFDLDAFRSLLDLHRGQVAPTPLLLDALDQGVVALHYMLKRLADECSRAPAAQQVLIVADFRRAYIMQEQFQRARRHASALLATPLRLPGRTL